MKDMMYSLQEAALDIEKELCDIDASLPLREELDSMADKKEKACLEKALDLLEQSFNLIDELLGPPQDELTGEPEGTAFSPEARGSSDTFSVDDLLNMFRPRTKHHTS